MVYCNHPKGKGGREMGTEAERQDTRKAMAYDLNKIFRQVFDKETCEKIAEITDQYLETANQK